MSKIQENMVPTPHIDAKIGEIAESILLPGDPLRAKFIADNFLNDVKQFNQTRGMLGFTGTYEGKKISVMGTGMGCPSIGIYSYELINFYGVKNLIRVGTAGSLQKDVNIRDVVIGMGACGDSNFANQFELPGNYSCIAGYELLEKAVQSAKKLNLNYHVGNILSTDVFYTPKINHDITWADMGVLACEMEAVALYTNAAYGKANALCILTISDNLITKERVSAKERQETFTDMMKLALNTILSL